MLDMLIQGGRVVTPAGVGDWDVGVVGEKIVSVAFPGSLPAAATQVIDARGKIVVPGGIETHAHAVANVQPGARTLVAGVPQRRAAGTLPGGHLGRDDDGDRFCPRAARRGLGSRDPRLPGALARSGIHGLFDALYLLEPHASRRDRPVP